LKIVVADCGIADVAVNAVTLISRRILCRCSAVRGTNSLITCRLCRTRPLIGVVCG
jgi:hypothetical protein